MGLPEQKEEVYDTIINDILALIRIHFHWTILIRLSHQVAVDFCSLQVWMLANTPFGSLGDYFSDIELVV